ncbi:MAG: AMP-binding protein [Opitutaceae bacterium]|nr:AMP-binding protein [Verrucomicrobiales bacterium]
MSYFLVQDLLELSAARLPAKTALVCDGRRFTYHELDLMANRCADALRSLGVQRGDRVGIYLPNSLEIIVGIFGALKAGAVFVPIHPSTKQDKLRYILDNCRATALLADARSDAAGWTKMPECPVRSIKGVIVCGKGSDAAEGSGVPCLAFGAIQGSFSDQRPIRVGIDLDLACLIYTSGSTGEPKGVMSDHSNVLFAASSIVSYLGNVESDVVINVLPLSFDYGLYQLLMTFLFGGTLVLERSFTFPATALKLMEQEGVTGFPGVPTIFSMLLQMDLSTFDLSRLRYLSNTAAALPASHILAIRNKFPQATLFSMYGLTETKRTLYLPPAELDRRPGSVGISIPGTEAWVEGDNGERLSPGEVGELVARGRHVMRGYWEAPELTARRFRPGPIPGERVCHTGDLFKQDEDGFFYFVGRKDDIIKSRGEKVAPKEVENVLYALPGVIEVAVVGVPDPLLGQAIKAFIVVNDASLTHQTVMAHCRRNLEDLMVPKHLEFRSELPKTSSGKINKTGLS